MVAFFLAVAPFALTAVLLLLEAIGLDWNIQERIYWGTWPVAGLLAVVAGVLGWSSSTHRVLGRFGFFLGAIELLATIVFVLAIVLAFRDLG